MTFEPYVADPAEPRRPRALANAVPAIALTALLLIGAAIAVTAFTRGTTEDPAIDQRPAPQVSEQTAPAGDH